MLASGTIVTLIEPDYFISTEARDLFWKHDILLKGADATTDDRINRINHKLKKAKEQIKNLGLKIIRASETQFLPSKYRILKLPFSNNED